MPDFMMVMKGQGAGEEWADYISKLSESGMFRGGSALGNGICVSQSNSETPCTVTGFMRFEADDIGQIRNLIAGNPVYEAGEEIEILEIIET